MPNNKGFSSLLLIFIFVLIFSTGGFYYYYSNQTPTLNTVPTTKSIIPTNPPINPLVTQILNKKVYLVIYNPKIGNQSTIEYFNWNNPDEITQGVINFFKEVTNEKVSYSIVKRQVYETFPIKTDGFTYTSESYLKCMSSETKDIDCHNPDSADYLEILRTTGACELLNKGEIDELWIWGGPYFGFWESNVAGPKGFFVNSPETVGSTCKKILPIMGYNYERTVNEAVHNFGHRAESVMKEVYGSWEPTPTHSWNRFSLLNKDTQNISGCGNTHFTPGSTQDYQYDPSQNVSSNCHEFKNFPNIKGEYKTINCTLWDCDELKFYKYWWSNFPQNNGTSFDTFVNKEIYNNWLLYVFDFSWRE